MAEGIRLFFGAAVIENSFNMVKKRTAFRQGFKYITSRHLFPDVPVLIYIFVTYFFFGVGDGSTDCFSISASCFEILLM
jgi:hypothetical protein